MSANFDTLKYTETLQAGGIDAAAARAHAEALASALGEAVATRADLRDTEARLTGRMDKLEGSMGELKAELNGRMDKLEGELGGRMDELEGQLGGRMDKLEGELIGLRGEIHVAMWSVGGIFAIMIAMLGWIISMPH